jgi:TLD
MMDAPSATTSPSEDDELLARLQSQFGDLDLSNLLVDGTQVGDDAPQEHNHEESEESSLAEPSAEELELWQRAQFAQGQKQLELKKDHEAHSVVERRRVQLRQGRQDEEEGWEQVAPLPDLKNQSSVFFPSCDALGNEIVGVHPMLQKLSEGDSEILGTSWSRLYSSVDGDGLSCSNLVETLRGYPGPTVMLIGAVPSLSKSMISSSSHPSSPRTRMPSLSTTTMGFYTTSPWIESHLMTGTTESFLFAMNEEKQDVQFFHPRQQGQPVMYCHPSTYHPSTRHMLVTQGGNSTATRDGLVHGIGIGGSPSQPRLHLTESLEECRAMDYCPLFEGGDLMLGAGKNSLNYFDVECIEVWAVGGDEWIADSLQARQRQRSILQATQQKARKIDKAQFYRDFQAGLLGSHQPHHHQLFSHMEHTANRCDF